MNEFLIAFANSLQDGSFIQIVLSRPWRDGRHGPEVIERVTARPIELKTGRRIQLTRHETRRETHENLLPDETVESVTRLFGEQFRNGHLFTSDADVIAKTKGAEVRVTRRSPTKQLPDVAHNREKQYLIPDGIPCLFLIEVGVMAADGRVRAARYDKFRQVNRFLEFVSDVYASLPEDGPIRVVDFGCGKSYLTFALHHLLSAVHGRDVEITGLDLKADVVEHCNGIADRLNCHGLRFVAGDMSTWEPSESVHLTVSLHACDTATDVALARSVAWESQVILSVPCCHHELASQMSRSFLAPVQRHGILHERLAETLTDGLRAAILEQRGYRTQVLEFIDLEHTPRNLLIRAVRRTRDEPAPSGLSDGIVALKTAIGLPECTLEKLLQAESPAG